MYAPKETKVAFQNHLNSMQSHLFVLVIIFHPFLLPLTAKPGENGAGSRGAGRLYWPAASALTARLRRLITAYQRTHKREQLRQEAMARPDGRRRRRPREHLFSMVTDGGGAYVQEDGAFMAEGSPYMAKGGAFIPEATVLPAEGGAAFKERRQRYKSLMTDAVQDKPY